MALSPLMVVGIIGTTPQDELRIGFTLVKRDIRVPSGLFTRIMCVPVITAIKVPTYPKTFFRESLDKEQVSMGL